MQILGVAAAVLLLAAPRSSVYLDTTTRTRNATYVSIASQMQFHTQRLAKAAGLAARGQHGRVRAAAGQPRRSSRDYLNMLQERRLRASA